MARRFYSSTAARTTLAAGVDGSQTTMSVTAVSGWPTSFPYTLVIDQDTVNEELVEVTGRTGTTITVTRGIDGTSGTSHDAGAVVQHGVSARDFDEPNAFINGTGTVTETLLASGAVTEAKLGTGAVTSAKILDGTIVNADINASAAIAQSKIADLTSDLASKPAKTSATTAPTSPATGDIWYDTNSTPPLPKFWDGSAWQVFSIGSADFSDAASGTYTDGGGISWKYKDYSSSSTLTVSKAGLIEVFIIAGGGGGGGAPASGSYGGGGGSGGSVSFGTFTNARYAQPLYIATGTYTVTVGSGGAGGTTAPTNGSFGTDSRLGEIYAHQGAPGTPGSSSNPFKGGSGGGGASGGSGITGQGNNGAGLSGGQAGGGGGIGGAASGATEGAGLAIDITGSSVTYGSGGSSTVTFTGPTIGGGGDGYAGFNVAGQTGGNGRVIVRVRTN